MSARRLRKTEATERDDKAWQPEVEEEEEEEEEFATAGGKESTVDFKKLMKVFILVKVCMSFLRTNTSGKLLVEIVLFELATLVESLVELLVLFELLLARVKTAAWIHDCPILHIRDPPFVVWWTEKNDHRSVFLSCALPNCGIKM